MNSEATSAQPLLKDWPKWLEYSAVIPTLMGGGLLLLVTGAARTLLPLFVVPFAGIHAWLLAQAWRYVFPPDEAHTPIRLAWQVSAWLAGLTQLAVALSLLVPNMAVSLLAIAATAIIVTSGVFVAVRTAHRRNFTDAFVWRLGLGTALLSLVIPIGVGLSWVIGSAFSTYAAGLGVVLGVLVWLSWGFITYRQGISVYLDRLEARATWWQLDKLALEMLLIFGCVVVLAFTLWLRITVPFGQGQLFQSETLESERSGMRVFALILLVVVILALWMFFALQSRGFVVKKKGSPLELLDIPLFRDRRWAIMLLLRTLAWAAGSFLMALVLAALLAVVQIGPT